jgi:tetratricopeptide (TPR) repeat protein
MLPDPPLSALLLEETLADPTLRGEVGEALMAFGRAAAMRLAGLPVGLRSGARLIEPTPEVVDRMLARRPRHPDLLELKIGAELEGAGGAPHAGMIDLLERYAAARPVDPMPRRHLARLLLESDDPSRAIPHLEYLDAREQKSAAYAAELARRYAAIGDWDRAWRKAQRTTQIAPFDATYREFAAGIAVRRGDFDRAERHIEALTELEPQHDRHRERLRRVREMRAEAGR